MTPRTPIWQYLRRDEIAAAAVAGAVVLVPIGSNEQHGSHLPLNTDIAIASAVCRRASEIARPVPALVGPPVWSGYSPHHMGFPGSLTLELSTFQSAVYELCICIWRHGFRKILLINGHGGNVGPLAGVALRLVTAGYEILVASHWDLIESDLPRILEGPMKGVGHACEYETSVMLHLQPGDVDMSQAVDFEDTEIKELSEAGIMPASSFAAGDPGVRGYASRGTADKGRRLVELAGAKLAGIVTRLQSSE